MTADDLCGMFHAYREASHVDDFENIPNKPSERQDVCAILLLDKLMPGKTDMICRANKSEIYFDIDLDELAKVITAEDIQYLVSCGVSTDGDIQLFMFI